MEYLLIDNLQMTLKGVKNMKLIKVKLEAVRSWNNLKLQYRVSIKTQVHKS